MRNQYESTAATGAASAHAVIATAARLACIAGALLLLLAAWTAPARGQQRAPGTAAGRSAQSLLPRFTRVRTLLRAIPLEMPVAGVRRTALRDSYAEGRSEGRVHQAIDIFAPLGTPVVAAADGRILRFDEGARGGNSIYQLATDGRTRFYYAHLSRYASGLKAGDAVRRGQVIGYVGDTGNAQPGDYQLHFSIAVLRSLRRWWEGDNLNPYPYLRGDAPLPLASGEPEA